MVRNSLMTELDTTKSQLSVLIVALLLTVDTINPVKIFLHVFHPLIGLEAWHLSSAFIFLLFYISFTEVTELLYFSVRIFFHSVLSIFFSQVEVIGMDNIPRDGPCIFVGNHANQFVDGIMLMATAQHKVSFLVAEKSWYRPIIGHFAYAMGAVPVARAQDKSKKCEGVITFTNKHSPSPSSASSTLVTVTGNGTDFTGDFNIGDKCRAAGMEAFKVTAVTAATTMVLEVPTAAIPAPNTPPCSFDSLARVDQSVVYNKVLAKLEKGGCIGIFPEGGSHDRTTLLPLKVGVALIAYTALEKRDMNIPIIPVGLNYFSAHRFRGKAIVEYGVPIYLKPVTLGDYKAGGDKKKDVCNELLERITDGMRSVIVTTPDYDTLKHIHVARRLWKRYDRNATQQKQDVTRRFSFGLQQLLIKFGDALPDELRSFMDRLKLYQKELDDLGIKDYQVATLDDGAANIASPAKGRRPSFGALAPIVPSEEKAEEFVSYMKIPYQIGHMLFVILIALVPAVFLNLPIGLLARIYANKKRRTALAGSKVKVKAYDVMLSEKVMFCIVMVPTLWATYGVLLTSFTNLDSEAIFLCIVAFPLFSYVGIMAAESGMVDFKDLKPVAMRILPTTRYRIKKLPKMRMKLVKELRHFVKQFGPLLGDLYFEKDVDWLKVQSNMKTLGEGAEGKKTKSE